MTTLNGEALMNAENNNNVNNLPEGETFEKKIKRSFCKKQKDLFYSPLLRGGLGGVYASLSYLI
ncbi:hypothetical protein SAMN05428975_1925 [Mucilaginibacter sp. OK268]|nr:hypothetical protein SAMN05428975_1925 [Mucilaginibacter sp. OK268]